MERSGESELSRRERQIMDVVYQRGRASAAEIKEAMPSPPGDSSVRTFLRILEEKGYLKRKKQSGHYVYSPVEPRSRAALSAMARVVKTFFGSDVEGAVAAILSTADANLTPEQFDRLAEMIAEAKRKEQEG
jgi:predicted transcriptional regulator